MRKFTPPICSQTFLINRRLNLRSSDRGIIENVLCGARLDLREILLHRFIFTKAPAFYGFSRTHAVFLSPLLSESNGAYMGGVKLFVCWRGGEGDAHTLYTQREREREKSDHISRQSDARQVGNQTDRMTLHVSDSGTFSIHFWLHRLRLRSLNFKSINTI